MSAYNEQKQSQHNFILLIGPEGCGKSFQTYQVAKEQGQECIEIEGTKENIESLSKFINLSIPSTIAIHDYTTMSLQAINSLLKVSEETPENLTIVLHSRENNVLKTIESRAHKIYMDEWGEERHINFIKEYLQTTELQELPEDFLTKLHKTSRTPGRFIEFLNCFTTQEIARIVEIVEIFAKIDTIYNEKKQTVKISNLLKIANNLYNKQNNINFTKYLKLYISYKNTEQCASMYETVNLLCELLACSSY